MSVSTKFKNECLNSAYANRLGKIISGDNNINETNYLSDFTFKDSCIVNNEIAGSVYVKSLTANFIALPSNIELLDKQVEIQVGVKYEDNTNEYISLGKYDVERPNDSDTSSLSNITAYDRLMAKIDSPYVCGIDYTSGNITVSDLYQDVCDNLDLDPTTLTFVNSDIPILDNPFTANETNRIVLNSIGKVSCSFVRINEETNKIELAWLDSNLSYTFDRDDYTSLNGGTIVYGAIDQVIIKNSQIDDENYTYPSTGEHPFVISEDYILYNADLREQAITGIYNKVVGLTYIDTKITCYTGKPFLQVGNKISIEMEDGSYITTYVLNNTFKYNGTFYTEISSPVLTETEVKTKQTSNLGAKIKETYIEVNKQKGEITSLTSRVTTLENGEEGTEYATVETVNTMIQTAAEGITNTFSKTGGANLLRNAIGLFGEEYWSNANDVVTGNTVVKQVTGQNACWKVSSGDYQSQTINVANGTYTISCKYALLEELGGALFKVNNSEFEFGNYYETIGRNLDDIEKGDFVDFQYTFEVVDNSITVSFIGNDTDVCLICNIMLNHGSTALPYSNNANETVSDTVRISEGVQITSTGSNTKFDAQSDGVRIYSTKNNEVKTEFTSNGTKTENLEATSGKISKILFTDTGNQTFITRVGD